MFQSREKIDPTKWPFPTGKAPEDQPPYGCDRCPLPPEYRCDICRQAIKNDINIENDSMPTVRINVSSGEDAWL